MCFAFVECFILGFFPCQLKFFKKKIFKCFTVKIDTVFIKAKCKIFKTASDLNITIFPSIVKPLHIFDLSYMIIEVCIPRILTVSLFVWIDLLHAAECRSCPSQETCSSNFTFQFIRFQTVKIFITDVWFLTKKVLSSAYAGYKKSCSNIFSLSMF